MPINNNHLAITMRKAAEFIAEEVRVQRLVVDETDPDGFDASSRALQFDDDVTSNAAEVARSLAGVLDATSILDHESRLLIAGILLASVAVGAASPEDPAVFGTSAFSVSSDVDPNLVFDKATLLAFSGLTLGMAQAIGDELDNRVAEEEEAGDGHVLDEASEQEMEMAAMAESGEDGETFAGEDMNAPDKEDENTEWMQPEHFMPTDNEQPPGGHCELGSDEFLGRTPEKAGRAVDITGAEAPLKVEDCFGAPPEMVPELERKFGKQKTSTPAEKKDDGPSIDEIPTAH